MASSAKQLGQTDTFTLHYFGLKGAAGTATILLEQGNVEYQAKKYGMEDWPVFKPKTPTGLLPIMEFADGTMIPESGAIARVAAAQAGLLGEGRDFAISEMLMGLVADLWKNVGGNVPTIMTIGGWTPEKTAKWNDEFKPKVLTQLGKIASLMKGDKYTEKGMSLGEAELWYRLYQLVNGPMPTVFEDVSGLKGFYTRVSSEPGPQKFANNQSKFGDLPNYFIPFP